MIYINPKNWIYLFLFYGLVCFILGFLGPMGKRGNSPMVPKTQEPTYSSQSDPVAQTGKYALDWLAELVENLRNDNTIPAFTNKAAPELIFCFPEEECSGPLKTFIEQWKSSFEAVFSKVNPVPIAVSRDWEKVIAPVLDCDPRYILIGVNATIINSDITGTRIKNNLYFSIPEQCQDVLQNYFFKFSREIKSFILEKRSCDHRELFRLTWEDSFERYLNDFDRIINILIEVLEQQQVIRRIKRV